MNYFLVVFLPHFDALLCGFGALIMILCACALVPFAVEYFDNYTNDIAKNKLSSAWEVWKRMFTAALIMLVLSTPIPNKKELIQLKVIDVLEHTDGLAELPDNIVKRLNALLAIENDDLSDGENG